jgi:signal transduction histidine kinase
MNSKIRSLDEFRSKLGHSLAGPPSEEGFGDRFRKYPPVYRTSHRRPLSVKEVKYRLALRILARELSQVKEKERHKLAAQLHDDFGQDLVLTKMRLVELTNRLPPQFNSCVQGIGEIIAGLIRRTRAAIDELSPEHICDGGLKPALKSLTEELQKKHGLVCLAKLEQLPKRFETETQQIIFRAVRELLFNVIKHAHTTRAKIIVIRKDGAVIIEVADDGRGFDHVPPELSDLSSGRFGLFSVRADLANVGADLRITSRVGKGTRAIITVPLEFE